MKALAYYNVVAAVLLISCGYRAHAQRATPNEVSSSSARPERVDPELEAEFNLATIQFAEGKIEEAKQQFEKVADRSRKRLGDQSRQTLTARRAHAQCLSMLGKHIEALKEISEVIDLQSSKGTSTDPDTLSSRDIRALISSVMGEHSSARAEWTEILPAWDKHGPEHEMGAMITRGHYAVFLLNTGHAGEALPVMERTFNYFLNKEGPHSFDTMARRRTLGVTFGQVGKHDEAEKQLRLLLQACSEKQLDASHPLIMEAKANLASSLAAQHRLAEAAELAKAVDETARNTPQVPARMRSASAFMYGQILMRLGDFPNAEIASRRAYDEQRRFLKHCEKQTLESAENLSQALFEQRKWNDAAEVLSALIECYSGSPGPGSAELTRTRLRLTDVCLRAGNAAEAERQSRFAFNENKRVHPEDNLDTLVAQYRLCQSLDAKRDLKKREPLAEEAVHLARDGYQRTKTALSQNNPLTRDYKGFLEFHRIKNQE